MATDSIDDMFDGCRSEAAAMIDLFGVFEWHFTRDFSFSWALAEEGVKKPRHKSLKEEHAIVIYIYTKMQHIIRDFNNAVQTGKHKYSTYRFGYHYFYFHLTEAIQVLKKSQPLCKTTYHRTQIHFNHNVVDRKMRLGAFTLAASTKSSFSFNGNVSCFEIYTCFGADVTYYSAISQTGQVMMLIPPYEVFHITDVLTNDPWCSVVYRLESTETPMSDLNCKLNQQQMQNYYGAVSTHWYTSSVGLRMLMYVILMVLASLVLIKSGQKCFVAAVMGALLLLIAIVIMMTLSQQMA